MDNKQNLDENIQKLTSSLNDTNDLIEEYRNTIKDNLINKEITHKSFGMGKVIKLEKEIIYVQFAKDNIKKFKIPDSFINDFLAIDDEEINNKLKLLSILETDKISITEKLSQNANVLNNEQKIDTKNIYCKEVKNCIEKGKISVDDNVEFRTIRDIAELFNKHYEGYQRSWIKIDGDWQRIAGCFQMSSISDRNIYRNILTADEECFYYLIKADTDAKKEEAVNGIINHEMVITYLFLKYPDTGYKFYGVFKKDVETMKKSIEDKQYKVVYKKIDNELDLTQFFK